MKARIDFRNAVPDAFKAMRGLEAVVHRSELEHSLLELVKVRVSQINGCGYCLDMHHKDAIHLGEEELRLHTLPAWKECPYYTDKEKAVLAYAEAMTLHVEVDDATFEGLKPFFSLKEITDLTLAIAQINSWNRLNCAFRSVPGYYEVGQFA